MGRITDWAKTKISFGLIKKIFFSKRFWKITGTVVLCIFAVFFITRAIVDYFASKELDAELNELVAAGKPITWEQLVPSYIPPDDENAAVIYYKQSMKFYKEDKTNELIKFVKSLDLNNPEFKPDIPKLKQAVEEHKEVIQELKKATEMKWCIFPEEYDNFIGGELPSMLGLQICAKLLLAEALIKYNEGKIDDALNNCIAVVKMGKHLQQTPKIIIFNMVGIGTILSGIENITYFLKKGNPNPQIYLNIIKVLDEIDILKSNQNAFDGERCGFVIGLYKHFINELPVSPQRTEDVIEITFFQKTYAWLLKPMLKRELSYNLKLLKRIESLYGKPYIEVQGEIRQIKEDLKANSCGFGYGTSVVLSPFIDQLYEYKAKIDLSKIGLALKYYKAKNGRYPDSLAELKGTILQDIPIDLFTGKDYIYKKEKDGFIVYSVGQNLVDDGGNKKDNLDIVWQSEN